MIEWLQFRCIHQDRNGIEGIRLFIGIVCQLRDVSLPDLRDMIADAETLLHVFDSLDETSGSLIAGRIFICDSGRHSQAGKLFVDLFPVGFQKHGEDHRIGKAVGNNIPRPENGRWRAHILRRTW